MAYSLNRAQLIGNLTRDPEVRQTSTGQTVASFSVATNFSWKDKTGQKQDKTEFHNIVAWGKLGEICGQYMNKGKKIFVEGRIQTRDWDGEDGVKRYRTEIVADNVIMLDRAGSPAGGVVMDREQNSSAVKNEKAAGSEQVPELVEEEVTIDDLPF